MNQPRTFRKRKRVPQLKEPVATGPNELYSCDITDFATLPRGCCVTLKETRIITGLFERTSEYRIFRGLWVRLVVTSLELVREKPEVLAGPRTINQTYPMDFVHDQLADGRTYGLFNVIDDYNCERLGIAVGLSLP